MYTILVKMMDYDDRYHPSNQNDVEKPSALDEMKKYDTGYNVITRKVPNKDGILKNKKIVVYNSGDIGSRIRDAITGAYRSDVVGTLNEHLYFSTILTGESPKGPLTLFFDSPEQYERHLHQTIPDRIKIAWQERRTR